MEAASQFTAKAPLIDAIESGADIFLLDGGMNLYRLDAAGRPVQHKPLLKNPLQTPVAHGGGKLSGSNAAWIEGGEVRRFSFLQATGQSRFRLSPHALQKCACSQDGRLIAYADSAGFVSIGSLENDRFYSLCPQVIKRVCALFFSPSGRWLFVGDQEGNALVYDLLTHRVAVRFTLPKTVDGGLFLEGGRLMLCGQERDLFFVSWHGGGVLQRHLPLLKVRPGALIAQGDYAFAGLESGAIAAIDTANRRLMRLWPLLGEPVALLARCGRRVVVSGAKGAVRVFDTAPLMPQVQEAMNAEAYDALRALLDKNGFLLLDAALEGFLENGWEQRVFPKLLSHIEQGQIALARELAAPFMDDPDKEQQFRHALTLALEMRNLREAVKGRHYDIADELIGPHPFLKQTLSGQLYQQSWMSAYEEALNYLEKGDKAGAKKALEHFLPVKGKVEGIGHLIHFAPQFLKARQLLQKDHIRGFFELAAAQPILKDMPHYELLIQKGEALRKQMLQRAEAHDYRAELACAKELARYAPYALEAKHETERIRLEALFHDAIRKDHYADAFELAATYPFLADEPAFETLYAPYQKRFLQAEVAALRGDSEGVLTLLSESVKNPLLKEGVAVLFRIAYTERFKSVTVSGAVDWERSFEHYTRLLGCDPLIWLAAQEVGEEKHLANFSGRTHLCGYEKQGFAPGLIVFKPMDQLLERNRLPLLQAVSVLLFLVIFGAVLALFATLIEKPMEGYKEEIKKESPYKLFENLAKRSAEGQP
ncbi:MAG: hypothetical protein AB7E49_02815 [Campylobacterales bacterium]